MSSRRDGKTFAPTEKPTLAAVLDYYGVQFREHVLGWQNILCPFTPEDRPSFRVALDEGGFKCLAHPKEQGGDSIAFVMLKEGYTADQFREALEFCKKIPGERDAGSQPAAYSRRSSGREYRPNLRRRRAT